VNVGGRNRMAMTDLRACVEAIGYRDVATHIQSGNVVFRTRSRSADAVAAALEEALARNLGVATPVMVRTERQLTVALDADPFPGADPKALHIGFLREDPAPDAVAGLAAPPGPDELRVIGRQVHLHYPAGMGRSKMSGAYLEKRLGVPLTVRNRAVTTALRDLLRA